MHDALWVKHKQRTVEDSGPGAETSNTILLDVGEAQMYTNSALGRSNPGENNLKLVVVVHYSSLAKTFFR